MGAGHSAGEKMKKSFEKSFLDIRKRAEGYFHPVGLRILEPGWIGLYLLEKLGDISTVGSDSVQVIAIAEYTIYNYCLAALS